MPVGVPKVAFLIPEDEEATWVDLYNRLHLERALFLGAKLEWELANNILSLMVYLTRADKTWEQFLFINCPGGWVVCGLAIFDMIRGVPPYVHTIGIGRAYSMGSLVLSAGEFSERLAFPHGRVLLHQPLSSYLEGHMLTPDTDEVLSLRETVIRLYSQRTGQLSWVIAFDLDRDEFLTPTEAKIHGIVDLVGVDLGGLRLGQRRQKETEERETEEWETEEWETEEWETEERETEERETEEREPEERETEEREPEEREPEERETEEWEPEEWKPEEWKPEEWETEEWEKTKNLYFEVFPLPSFPLPSFPLPLP
uniref:clp protease proteolytic subunit n=1 Tax=Dactylicapnos schneideri TaxID=3134978 RepID=UPI0030FED78B